VRTRPRLTLIASLLCSGLLLAGCSGDDEGDPQAAGADPQATAEGQRLLSSWPLTGEPVRGEASSERDHPVVVAKIDNTSSSAPQEGLDEAELVVEELVEGGTTRLAAFFYRDLPTQVGPVRSMRATDIGIVRPIGASVVTSGAAAPTVARIQQAGIPFYAEGAKGIYRVGDRSAPYNLFADVDAVTPRQPPARPSDYLPFGPASDNPRGEPARTISATFSAARTSTWELVDGTYRLTNGYTAPGQGFPADTVLALTVKVGDAGYLDPAGNPVPETIFEGTGDAVLFHDGRAVRGTWTKDGLGGALRLKAGGRELVVPPGRTWIELLPESGGSVGFSR